MNNQRRGLGSGAVSNDMDTRKANMSLMNAKRRQQLEAQLEEKVVLFKQFTNTRGIGLKGQSVPQRDIEILQQQIDAIRQQLEGNASAANSVVTPSQIPPPRAGGYVPQLRQDAPGSPPPSNTTSNMCTPIGSGRTTKRDEVWQRKYEAWLRRSGSQKLSLSTFVPPVVEQQSVSFGRRSTPPLEQHATPTINVPVPQPVRVQQPVQPLQQPQHGRRASGSGSRPW